MQNQLSENTKFIFINNHSELDKLSQFKEFDGTSVFFITFNPEVYLILKNKGFKADYLYKYLNENVYNDIIKNAEKYSNSWFRDISDLITFNGFNLGKLSSVENFYFCCELISSITAVKNWIKINKPDLVSLFPSRGVPSIRARRFNNNNDISKSILIDLLINNRISVKYFTGDKDSKNSFLFLTLLLKYIRLVIKNFLFLLKYNEIKIKETSGKKIKVMNYSVGYDSLIISSFLRAINDNSEYLTYIISSKENYLNKERAGLPDYEGVKKIDINNFFRSGSLILLINLLKIVYAWYKFRKITNKFNSEEKIYYPLFQFSYLFSEYFFNCLNEINYTKKFLDELNPDIFLINDNASSAQRILTGYCKARNIKTISIPHGCINDIEEYRFETDYFFAWGELSKYQLIKKYGYKENSIKITGSPVMDTFKSKNIIKKNEKNKNVYKILILTGAFTSEVFGRLDIDEYKNMWDVIQQINNNHKNLYFYIKPHPAVDYHSFYRSLSSKDEIKKIELIENKKLDDIIADFDLVILNQIISTAGLIPMYFDIPLIYLDNAIRRGFDHTSEDWNKENGINNIHKVELLEAEISNIIYNREHLKNILEKQRKFLAKYVCQDDSSLKIRETFKEIAQNNV